MKPFLVITIFLFSTQLFSQQWYTNYDKALEISKKENKKVLIVFSGSDWCGPCIKMDRRIWQTTEFEEEAKKNWVLLKIDFPRGVKNRLSEEQTEHNNKIALRYNEYGRLPTVVVLSNEEKVLGETGYTQLTVQQYLEKLNRF